VTDPPNAQPAAPPATPRLPASLAAELLEASLHAVPTVDLRDIGARMLAPLVRVTGAGRASLMLVNPDTGKLRIVAGLGLKAEFIGKDVEWRPNSISEWVFRKRQGLVLNGTVKQEGLVGTGEGIIESAMCVPLIGDDAPLGVLNIASTGTGPAFSDEDLRTLGAILPPVGAAMERAVHANVCNRNTHQFEQAKGLRDRTLLVPGRYEGRNYEMGLARVSSVNEGGAICERVPLASGGHVLMALDPRASGVDALLTASFAQGVFVSAAQFEKTPAALVQRLNAELCSHLQGRGEMGAWIGVLGPNGQLASCTAGYTAPMWIPADDSPVSHLGSGGPMVGADAKARWDEETVRLLPGDMLIAVSAGVLGARNVTGQPFGPARLAECVEEHRRKPLDTMTEGIVRTVLQWTGRPLPVDDLSVLAVRFAPGC
jgi:hypothetical protein